MNFGSVEESGFPTPGVAASHVEPVSKREAPAMRQFGIGQPIRRVTLVDGARITMGRTTLVFRRDRE